jgi:diaminopropionate ammonia-lyase
MALEHAKTVEGVINAVFDYQPTPLVELKQQAASLGLSEVHVKDEGRRLGLRSFKALGGAYAVIRLVLERLSATTGKHASLSELPRSASGSLAYDRTRNTGGTARFHEVAKGMVFACATDGNHGQSVAAGAHLVGARAVIFVHEGVTPERVDAISKFGAEIRVVKGSYDDAVAEAKVQAKFNGWTLLSDTTWPGYTDIPQWVMQGYSLITAEALKQLARPPTHVFLQAGVGGMAAAIAYTMNEAWPQAEVKFVVVEPDRAACLLASAKAGKAVAIEPQEPTLMSMLECYEPSLLAWDVLSPLVTAFVAVGEQQAVEAMKVLAFPLKGDRGIVAGESGAAGLAGLLYALATPELAAAVGLGHKSRILLINTESATDEARYAELLGTTTQRVREGLATTNVGRL